MASAKQKRIKYLQLKGKVCYKLITYYDTPPVGLYGTLVGNDKTSH